MKSTAKLLHHNVKSRHHLKKSVLFSKKTSLLFLTSKDTTFFAPVQIKWTDWPKLQCLKQFRLTPHKQYNGHTQQYKIPLIENFQNLLFLILKTKVLRTKNNLIPKKSHSQFIRFIAIIVSLLRHYREIPDGQPTVNYTNIVGLLYHFT